MSLIGLTENEIYKLKKSVGVGKRKMAAEIEPIQAYKILNKALKQNTAIEISKYLKLTSPTQIYRTINIFENLIPELHNSVTYRNKKTKDQTIDKIGFQQASELSKFDKSHQLNAFNAITKYNLSWQEIKSFNQLLNRSGKKFDEVVEVLKERKGIGENFILVFSIDLKKISNVVYELSQDERNNFFKPLVVKYFKEKIKEVHLGTSTMAITFEKKAVYFSKTDKEKIKTYLIDEMKNK